MRTIRFIFALVLILTLLGPVGAVKGGPAENIPVTTATDEYDTSGSGSGCSLREAIQAANTDSAFGGCPAGSGADVISLPANTYKLTLTGFQNAGNDLLVTSNITINGADQATTVIESNVLDRVLEVRSGAAVVLNDLTITGGRAPDGAAGADGAGPGDAGLVGEDGDHGGGIYNEGTLTLNRCKVSGNKAGSGGRGGNGKDGSDGATAGADGGQGGQGGMGGEAGSGGGIYNEGTLTLNACIIDDNQSGDGGAGGAGGQGGAGAAGIEASGPMGGDGGAGGHGGTGGDSGNGGGIFNDNVLVVKSSRLSNNRTGDGGAGGVPGAGGAAGNGDAWGDGGSGGQGGNGGGGRLGGGGGGLYSTGPTAIGNSIIRENQTGKGGDAQSGASGGEGGTGGWWSSIGHGGAGGPGGRGGSSGSGGRGGGIQSTSALTVTATTISLNQTGDGAPGASGGPGGNAGSAGAEPNPGVGGDGGSGGNGGEGGSGGYGGGAHSGAGTLGTDGPVKLIDCTIRGNITGIGGDGGPGGDGGNGGSGSSTGENGDGGAAQNGSSGGDGGGLLLYAKSSPASGSMVACTFGANSTGNGGMGGDGGDGGSNWQETTDSGNGGNANRGGDGGRGGGISAGPGIKLDLANSTISGNATGDGGDGGDGGIGHVEDGSGSYGGDAGMAGGIYNSGETRASNVTLAYNKASGTGGSGGSGRYDGGPGKDGSGGGVGNVGVFYLGHTVLSNNAAASLGHDCTGTLDSLDYNLIKLIGGCTLSGTAGNDLTGLDGELSVLADHGGPTETHLLLATSPALDSGGTTCSHPTDQRGSTRPADGDGNASVVCDRGAVEMQGNFRLSVGLDGQGQGTVTSTPQGIDCGGSGTSCAQDYRDGATVTLAAVAKNGSSFGAWSNDCSGASASCQVVMNADRAVTATFSLDQFQVFLPVVLRGKP